MRQILGSRRIRMHRASAKALALCDEDTLAAVSRSFESDDPFAIPGRRVR